MDNQFLLAGDIGGTKTVLALFSFEKGPTKPLFEISYSSNSYSGFDPIIRDFFSKAAVSAATACFGVAGPVRNGRTVITKLPWQPDSQALRSAHGFSKATLINDLVATGYALPHLSPEDLLTINDGISTAEGAIGIIAPGTGLGEAIFAREGSQYIPIPSEGGHTDFAPLSEIEIELLNFLNRQYDHVSYDRICSGPGLPDIFDFIKTHLQIEEPEWLAAELADAEDRTPVIVNGALHETKTCDICRKAVQMFVSVLGAEAGNLALKGLTTGGMYVGGGIPPRIQPFLKEENFMNSFTAKGRMSYLLNDMPVKVILNSKAALIGAASFGLGLRFDSL